MDAIVAMTWLIALPLVASPLIYLVGRVYTRGKGENAAPNPASYLTVLVLLAAGVLLYVAGGAALKTGALDLMVGAVLLRMDGVSVLLAATVLTLGTAVAAFSIPYMANEVGEEKYYAMLTAVIGTMIGLGCAADIFNLWVWFEAMAVTTYLLVAYYREQPSSLEAGFKYLVQSATGSVLVLLGIALVFFQTGSTDLAQIRAAATPGPVLMAAGALFLIGFGVKTALVPMHTWLPDAHSQAPSGISAMLSGVVIEAGLVALLRALGALAFASTTWGTLLLVFGALNMLFGNLMALRQTQVKRLLAYSSLSHIGYILLGMGTTLTFGLAAGAAGGFFHIFTHAMMKGLAFLAAGTLLYSLHIANADHGPLVLDDLCGASRRYPLAAFAMSVAVLGLGGLPPLAGFMSKWQIFVAGAQTQNTALLLLVIFAALNSVLSLGYYAPLVNRLYRHEPAEIIAQGKPVSRWMSVSLIVLTLIVVVLGFWPTLIGGLTGPAGVSLLAAFGG